MSIYLSLISDFMMWQKITITLLVVAVSLAGHVPVFAQSDLKAEGIRLKRGEYIVERMAMCADCHTERDWKGTPNKERWLQGAKLDFKPDRIMPWAAIAPSIAGLPGFTNDTVAVNYFETGLNSAGKHSAPPMPQYRFNREDAESVVAYLRTLKAVK